ncbi:MAG: TetR/AcrR family transcriptional regulator [Anaerolineaceae bacterium]|nr:TetR/AcrR family transcriptional regulator [Anaerolineaceae bacterium]
MHELILERGYDEFNIQDVTDKANLGRATFYLHYREKDDLLTDLMNQRFEEFIINTNTPQFVSSRNGVLEEKAIEKLFNLAENNYDFYRIMEIGKGGTIASNQMQRIIRDKVRERLLQLKQINNKEFSFPQDFLETYLSGALLSLIYWWLENDMPYTSAEMAKMYQRINAQISEAYLPQDTEKEAAPEKTSNKPSTAKTKEGNAERKAVVEEPKK